MDAARERLDSLLTDDVLARAGHAAWEEFSPLVDEIVKATLGSSTGECEGEPASALLRECIQRLASELRSWADGYSALRWLWMLRRLPRRVFEGDYSTTLGYDSVLAEVIAGSSKTDNPRARRGAAGQVFYYVEGTTPARLARFCGGIRLLSNFHRWYRWAGKGARFSFERRRQPTPSVDPRIQRAVETYDKRVERSGLPLRRLGSVVSSRDDLGTADGILWLDRVAPMELPSPPPGVRAMEEPPLSEWHLATANFLISRLDIRKLKELVSDSRVSSTSLISQEVAALLYLLTCGSYLLVHHIAGFYGLLSAGYLIWLEGSEALAELTRIPTGSPFVNELLAANLIRTREEALAILQDLTGRDWPLLAGPVWLQDGGAICLDLYAAANRLNTLLQFPTVRGGAAANARAAHFEIETQAVIDISAWRAVPETCPRRQTTLQRGGKAITNIDAVGERDGTLLLVSCKSAVYSDEYDAGDYRTVRNASSDIEKAVKRWQEVLTELREHPRGDNYDLSAFDQLIGVVCTPHVVYVLPDVLEQMAAPGLPVAASISELSDWLAGK